MANVIEIEPRGPDEGTPTLGVIRPGSRALAVLFTALLAAGTVIVGGLVVAGLAYAGDRLQICPHNAWIGVGRDAAPPGCRPVAVLPAPQRLAYVAVGIVRAAPALMILWNLRALFRLYARGVIFARENASRLKGVGAWLVAGAFAPLTGHLFLAATGMEIDKAWLHMASFEELILGALVFVIAQVMQVGHELEEEQGRFV